MWSPYGISFLICQNPYRFHSLIDFLFRIKPAEAETDCPCWKCADRPVGGWRTVEAGPGHDAEPFIQFQRRFCRIYAPDVKRDNGYPSGCVLKAVNRDIVNSSDTLQKKFCQTFFMGVDSV